MRKQLKYLVGLSLAIFLPLSLIFTFVSKSFSQTPVNVSSFSYLNTTLQSTQSATISITIPTITSTGNYSQLNGSKTIIGLPDGPVLDGNGHVGIFCISSTSELHLSSITMNNFKNVGTSNSSVKNGTALHFSTGAHLYFDGNVTIASNTIAFATTTSTGGDCAGVYITSSAKLSASSGTLNFTKNSSIIGSGAALYFNNSTGTFFNNTIFFQENQAGDSGAALHVSSATTYTSFINSTVTFSKNTVGSSFSNSFGRGGAINIIDNAKISFQGTTQVQFTSNTALDGSRSEGGAIYAGGHIEFACSSVSFIGNVAGTGGAISVNTGGLVTLNSSNGDIIFTDNGADEDRFGHDIYLNDGIVNINGNSGKVEISSGIAGDGGEIHKSGDGLFLLGGANQHFTGLFTQSGGTTTVTREYFTGLSSITAGLLEIKAGGNISAGTIGLWDTGLMKIESSSNLTFEEKFIGNGTILKQSTKTLTLTGDNSGFEGLYRQLSGTTLVKGPYFAGISSITGTSLLELGGGADLGSGGKIELWDSAKLNITASDGIEIKGKIIGEGSTKIEKSGEGEVTLREDNSEFKGTFYQERGKTVLTGPFFVGLSNITNGSILELVGGASVPKGGVIDLSQEGEIHIRGAAVGTNVTFEGKIQGTEETKILKDLDSGSNFCTLQLKGDNSGFKGTFVQKGGTTTWVEGKYFSGVSSITGPLSKLNFENINNDEIKGNIELWDQGGLEIRSLHNLTFTGKISGEKNTCITYMSDTGELTLRGDNSGFKGTFVQYNNAINVEGPFFIGVSSINGGILNFNQGATLSTTTEKIILENSTLNINSADNLTFRALIEGNEDSMINKLDSGILTLSGDNSGFKGTFCQNSGITNVQGTYFAGVSSIIGGTLNFNEDATLSTTTEKIILENSILNINNIPSGKHLNFAGNLEGTANAIINKSANGVLVLSGNNSAFKGAFVQKGGTARVEGKYFSGVSSITGNSTLEFSTGTVLTGAGEIINLWEYGRLHITMPENLTLREQVRGTAGTAILKTSTGTLTLVGNNSDFDGTFIQLSGITNVEGLYFTGISSIAAGTLNFNQGTKLTELTKKIILTNSILSINTRDNLNFAGKLEGNSDATINKRSSMTLTLLGDNSGFEGLYRQLSGTTLVKGPYFAGTSSITGTSLLELGDGADLGSGGKIELWDRGVIEITALKELTIGKNIVGAVSTYINKRSSMTLTLLGDNSGFGGLYRQLGGMTLVKGPYFAGTSSMTETSVLELGEGADLERGGKIELWDRSMVKITTPYTMKIAGEISGLEGTEIEKSGEGEVTLSGDNSGFKGRYVQSVGTTVVTGAYFAGISSITGGVLEYGGTHGEIRGTIGLWGSGVFSINRDNASSIGGQIIGNGTIQKPGSGLLTITESNLDFGGEFIQTAGTTTVTDIGSMFRGLHRIESSLLEVAVPDISGDKEIDYRVELSSGGILEHKTTGVRTFSTTISSQSIKFIGSGAKAEFKGDGNNEPRYVLEEGLEDLGERNEVVFEGSYVDVNSDTYKEPTIYRFNNTTIDIDNSLKIRTVGFANLVTKGSKINTLICIQPSEVSGSKLMVTNNPDGGGRNKIKLGMVTVAELGTNFNRVHTVQLLDEKIEFEKEGTCAMATMAYEYDIKVDSTNLQNVIVYSTQATNGISLNKMNVKEGNRLVMFSFNDTYYPDEDLAEMSLGEFYVKGDVESRIVAKSSTTGERVSLFKVERAGIEFELIDVELVEAEGEKGAALLVNTNTAEVIVDGVGFISNIATGLGGGGLYVGGGGAVVLRDTKFEGNSAKGVEGRGGAICIEGATVTLSGIVEVRGNSASGNGGGIYLENGQLNVFDSIVFRENKANGKLNGLYMEGDSYVNFGKPGGSEGVVATILDGIKSKGEGGEFNLHGNTQVNLGQAGDIVSFSLGATVETRERVEAIIPNLNINDKGVFNILGDTGLMVSKDVRVGKEAGLRIDGTSGHGIEVGVGSSFCQEGLLVMNLFGKKANVMRYGGSLVSKNNYDLVGSDLINVDEGIISLSSSTSKLSLNTNDAFSNSNLETFRWKVFKLMKYGQEGRCEGEFGKIELEGNLPKSYLMRYDYLGEYIALMAEGSAITRPTFALLGLGFNQTEVAKTLDYFCDKAYNGKPGAEAVNLSRDVKELGDKLQEFMSMLDYEKESELKETFFDLSGYFISNVIISRAYDDVKREIYNRIYNYKENEEPEKGMWGQAKGMRIYTDKDGESPDKFKVTNIGILVGFDDFDMMTSSTVMTGAYIKHNKSLIKQGNDLHNADVSSIGVGMYVAVLEEKYDLKALGFFNFDNYETTRNIKFEKNTKAKGEFRGNSTKIDVEAGYRIGIGSNSVLGKVKLRPYIEAGLTFVHTDGFKEKGAAIWNLDVMASNYIRTEVGGGLGFTGNGNKYGKKFRWNLSCGLGCMLAGKNEEIKSKFIVGDNLPNEIENRDFKSRSVTLDAISVVGEIGLGYYITEGLEGYCSCDTRIGTIVKDVCANVGVRYSFDN
jgi:hypothetical protein